MEAARLQDPLDAQVMLQNEVFEATNPVEAAMAHVGMSTVVEDIDPKEGPLGWQQSPARTTSLLPPFGSGQPSHLPTPQSPGNLAGYLAGPAQSPLSSDNLRASLSHQFTTFRPPSRPASTHPPKTPHREHSTSTPKIPPRSFPPPFRTDLIDKGGTTDPAWIHASQIATPSPEISRTRHASVPNTPSDSETMLATPSAGKRSSSHPHNENTTLAPALIISPANSSHSTIYHGSPEIESGKHGSPSYDFSHSMAALVSDRNPRNTTQSQETGDLADPFIVRDDGGRNGGLTKERYPSPPISRNLQHCSTHGNSSSPLLRARTASHDKSAMVGLFMSPSEASEAPSHGSPVKAEVEDEDYDIALRAARPAVLDGKAQYPPPRSPHTPPRAGSSRDSEIVLRTPPLEQSAFHTPLRVPGGEMERIRQRQAESTDARMAESEKRRPDYLVRTKRTHDGPENEEAERERENAVSGLGVTVSPMKGRRLKLYRPIPIPGVAVPDKDRHPQVENAEPKTPPPPLSPVTSASVPAMSLRAINWQTPDRRRTSPVIWTEEDEIKKQRRLAAFAASESPERARRLRPVEVPGQGRIVIDITSAGTRELAEAGILEIPPPDSLDDVEGNLVNGLGTEWPDSEYPWSLQRQQRDRQEEAERRRRLRWIERFLDRESESEEDDRDGGAGPSTRSPPFDVEIPSRTQRGRGKSISLRTTPGSRRTAITDRRVFGAANSDARQVLMSKKHVREVAERVRRRKAAEEEEGVVMCICQGADDGRPMVRCDECRTWYHLVCMDIADESELGDEWFCWKCVPSAEDPPPVFEPTFAPAMPDTPPRISVGDLPLYQTSLQPSPMLDIRTRAPVSPTIPTHLNHDREQSPPRRSRLPHLMADPDDPVRGGPSTPYHPRSTDSRLYSTPKFYDDHATDEYLPFDPTSTPSRGLKFPNVPITPRRPHNWTGQGPLWTTPSALPRTPLFSSQTPSSSARSLAYSLTTLEDSAGPLTSPWPSDDSPVRRPHKSSESNYPYPPPRRLLESPLAARGGGGRPFLPGVEESPTARYTHRSKDKDLGERPSRPPHGPG